MLEPEDDVAHVKWGGGWRMPTKAEFNELMDNCTWTWSTMNGVNGYFITSNKSGYTDRFIFLPAAGDRRDSDLNCADRQPTTPAATAASPAIITILRFIALSASFD